VCEDVANFCLLSKDANILVLPCARKEGRGDQRTAIARQCQQMAKHFWKRTR